MPDADIDLERHASLLIDTVRDAGVLALQMRRGDVKSWIKGVSSPVSEADIAVNDLIEARLRTSTPDYGWLSEESAEDASRLRKTAVWVVDPIDGTRAYLARRADWSISVALVQDGLPVLAAVFAPASDEFFFAHRAVGAELNGAAIRTSDAPTLDFARITGPQPLVERLPTLGEGVEIHPRIGSLALRLCRVGSGRIDAAFAGGKSHDWDLAAADLIVHEAGGQMTEITGEPLVYNRSDVTHGVLIAAGRDRHRCIVEHFRAHPLL